jgi:hypothetical protein
MTRDSLDQSNFPDRNCSHSSATGVEGQLVSDTCIDRAILGRSGSTGLTLRSSHDLTWQLHEIVNGCHYLLPSQDAFIGSYARKTYGPFSDA